MKILGPLFVLAIIMAGLAYYTLFAEPRGIDVPAAEPSEVSRAVPVEPEEPERESFSGAGSIYSVLSRGDRVECDVTYIPNPVEPDVYGNFFTNNGDLRGDFVVPTPDLTGQTVTSIIIADGSIWQWTDINGEVVGSKQAADYSPAVLERLVAPIGLDTEVQYSCLTWPQVDSTIFEAPATVLFTDVASATFEEGIIFEGGEF